ncbi:MAG TPA: MEDS domain-containing protein [Terriglobales bacterium]|jgi:hypothetical protein|nr:MEDS domain-containing protein [Terriglobales bacterium]
MVKPAPFNPQPPQRLSCVEVLRNLSSYIDSGSATHSAGDESTSGLHNQMRQHLSACPECASVLEGCRNVQALVGEEHAFDLPAGFSERLQQRLAADGEQYRHSPRQIPFGITQQEIALGSHIIYFWKDRQEFERGVNFLEPGLIGNDYCIVFGHQEAIDSVLATLSRKGFDVDLLVLENRLTILHRDLPVNETLAVAERLFRAAEARGASAIRWLGNLGVGRDPLPAGEDDVLELEARITGLARNLPCVIVCMYDVATLPGRMVMKGGLETHPFAVCGHTLQENPYFVSGEESHSSIRRVQ